MVKVLRESSLGTWFVYALISPDGKVYIGKCNGNPLSVRWKNGHGYLKNKELQYDINERFGWDAFDKVIIIQNTSYKAADFMEKYYIALHQCMKPDGYNGNSGGDSGFYYPPIVIEAMRLSHIGKGVKPVLQLDPKTGDTVKEWPSIKEAADALNISAPDISAVANGAKYRHTAGGYGWKFPDTPANTTKE